jgi:hypothetical protein
MYTEHREELASFLQYIRVNAFKHTGDIKTTDKHWKIHKSRVLRDAATATSEDSTKLAYLMKKIQKKDSKTIVFTGSNVTLGYLLAAFDQNKIKFCEYHNQMVPEYCDDLID